MSMKEQTVKTSCLLIFVLLLGQCICETKVQVLSPTKFRLSLPEGRLDSLTIHINGDGTGVPDFEKNETDSRVLYFSRDDLNLKKGDAIHYLGVYEHNGQPFGEGGIFIFDGVFAKPDRQRRQTPEASPEESTEEYLEDPDATTNVIESRFGGPPRRGLHHSPQGRFRFDHRGPPYFGPPHDRPPGPPLFHYRPGPWGGDHKDRFWERGPWDGHGDDDDFNGGRFDGKHWHHNPGFDGNRPGGGSMIPGQDPVRPGGDAVRPGEGPAKSGGGTVKPIYEDNGEVGGNTGNSWNDGNSNTGSNQGVNSGGNSLNQGTGGSSVQPVTKEVTTTTTTTTEALPQIDIRFPDVDDE